MDTCKYSGVLYEALMMVESSGLCCSISKELVAAIALNARNVSHRYLHSQTDREREKKNQRRKKKKKEEEEGRGKMKKRKEVQGLFGSL
jgi:hypothetical protein